MTLRVYDLPKDKDKIRIEDNLPFKEAEALRTYFSKFILSANIYESLRKQIHGLKAECCLGCHQDVYKELCRQRSSQAQLRGRDPSRLHRGGDIFSF